MVVKGQNNVNPSDGREEGFPQSEKTLAIRNVIEWSKIHKMDYINFGKEVCLVDSESR